MDKQHDINGESTMYPKLPWQIRVILWWTFIVGLVVLATELAQNV